MFTRSVALAASLAAAVAMAGCSSQSSADTPAADTELTAEFYKTDGLDLAVEEAPVADLRSYGGDLLQLYIDAGWGRCADVEGVETGKDIDMLVYLTFDDCEDIDIRIARDEDQAIRAASSTADMNLPFEGVYWRTGNVVIRIYEDEDVDEVVQTFLDLAANGPSATED